MKGIMWLTIVLVVSLVMVLGLVLLLLAELYCSPIIHRLSHLFRQETPATATTTIATDKNLTSHSPSLLDNITTHAHAHPLDDIEKRLPLSPENQDSGITQHQDKTGLEKGRLSHSVNGSSLVYISNPIYDDENVRGSRVDNDGGTPFETPDSSPSRLETEDSSGDDEREEISSKVVVTPPLTPMKKLPADACSVRLKDGSLGTWSSDTNSNVGISSSCSLTPCTSPSL